jgi:hypothetical protein
MNALMSHHGPSHPFKDGGAVVDSPTGIHTAIVKCLFVVNRSCIHKGFRCTHRCKSRGFKSGERGGNAVGTLSTSTSVTTGVTENISHSTAKMCRSTVIHALRSCSAGGTSSDVCQTIRNYPDIFERMQRSMVRRVEAWIESHGG